MDQGNCQVDAQRRCKRSRYFAPEARSLQGKVIAWGKRVDDRGALGLAQGTCLRPQVPAVFRAAPTSWSPIESENQIRCQSLDLVHRKGLPRTRTQHRGTRTRSIRPISIQFVIEDWFYPPRPFEYEYRFTEYEYEYDKKYEKNRERSIGPKYASFELEPHLNPRQSTFLTTPATSIETKSFAPCLSSWSSTPWPRKIVPFLG